MKIRIIGQKAETDTVTLELYIDAEIEGEALIRDKEQNWFIISFREVNGKLSLVRHSNINDGRFNLNEDGQIEEVDE